MVDVNLQLDDLGALVDFGDDEADMARYKQEGTARALAIPNRGPISYDPDGSLSADILEAYWREGFYVFENVVGAEERRDIEVDVAELLERAPIAKDSSVDKHGRPALGSDCKGRSVRMTRPLSDPLGGTDANHGRHPVKMAEPIAPDEAPEWIVQLLLGTLQH